MNRYIQPSGTQKRLVALQRIAQQGAQDAAQGVAYVRPETLAEITVLAPRLAAAVDTAKNAKSAQAATVVAAEAAVTAVSQYTRDIWAAVKRRTTRDGLAASAQVYYGLTLNGRLPQVTTQDAWLNEAERIIEGEELAVAAGYPALTTVPVAQLQIRLNAARTATSQRITAKTNYRNNLATLKTLSQEAGRLIAVAMRELRASLGEEAVSARRQIMRDYGARFMEQTEEGTTGASVLDEVVENLAAPAVMGMAQPYAVTAVNGNGTAVHV